MRPRKYPLPAYFLNLSIRGFEEDDDKSKKDPPKGGENDDDDDDSDDDDDEGGEGGEGEGKGNAGLKSALQKERRERRKLERENKRLAKAQKEREDAEKDDATKAKDSAAAAEAKAIKLAARLKDAALENSIIKHAQAMDFVDIDDALRLVDRDAIDIDQDEDDPSDIDLDEKTVKKALEALKERKPHLVKSGDKGKPPPPKSGSKFSGGEKSKEQLDEEALMAQYPALRRGSR